MSRDSRTTAKYWSRNVAGSDPFSPQVYWLAVPEVQAYFQRRSCAGKNYPSWIEYCLGEFIPSPVREQSHILSVGCGTGGLERHLFALHGFGSCDAFDIAPGAIAIAEREAAKIGMSTVHYAVRDVQKEKLGHATYDSVWFNGSLHHVEALEPVCANVRSALKPDGWLFFSEYVGPSQFAFGKRQREAIEAAFHLLPPVYRRSFTPGAEGRELTAAPLPDPREVARADPSEAIRSSDIMRVVRDNFEIVALNQSGGTLLHCLLSGIAGHFRGDDPHSIRLLEMLFNIEDALIASGDLDSDFVFVAARPRR
jgi:SAM-dependent methyltransferase